MRRIVSEQKATVLYYSLLNNFLLLWVLQPAEGVVRFYSGKLPSDAESFPKLVSCGFNHNSVFAYNARGIHHDLFDIYITISNSYSH